MNYYDLLGQFRFTGFFPAWVRSFLSDFAVIIGILLMTGIDYFSGTIRVTAWRLLFQFFYSYNFFLAMNPDD
jgi:hypothetical protein